MNYKISGGTQEVRLSYLPFLRDRLMSQLQDPEDDNANNIVIEMMDSYGLDRDDVFENLDEFKMDAKAPNFADIDSKKKAAFTRAYNAGSHKSQALVDEQGAPSKKKKKGDSTPVDPEDPDAIDDDVVEPEESDDDEEEDLEKLKAMFKKRGRKAGGGDGKAKSGAAKGRKKK
jgi:replication factor C subunit 1